MTQLEEGRDATARGDVPRAAALSAREIAELVGQHPPTPEQARVIESPLSPALVVAGAGSGKTETMAARVVWLIANGLVEPDQVLGLTFTRKAAGELGERVRLRLRALARRAAEAGVTLPGRLTTEADALAGLARPNVQTYHSYAAALVGDHALRLGLDPSTRLLGEAAQWQLASEVVEHWSADLDTDAATTTVVEAVLALSAALDEHLLDPAQAREGIERIVDDIRATPPGTPPREPYADVLRLLRVLGERARVLDVVAAYRRRKRASDAIDFGDQVALAARLARDVPEVGAGERERFRVVLLDEYQDTSFAQLTLLRSLFGGGHPVTAVGDPHQSIYGWRGASAGGLTRFPTDFPTPAEPSAGGAQAAGWRPADVHQLSTSWRNDQAVLDVANAVAAPLRARERTPVAPLAARPGAGPGRVLALVADTVDLEAQAIARFVAQHWRSSTTPPTAAVLCRKRSQFSAVRQALRAEGLPVEVVGLGGLLSTPEVVDLVATLHVVHDPTRGDALVRLLTGARTRLGAADLHALGDWATDLAGHAGRAAGDGVEQDVVDQRSIVDALDALPPPGRASRSGRLLTEPARRRLERLALVLRALRAHAYLPLPDLVAEAERLLGLDIEVASRPGISPGRARAHLDAFRDVAVEFASATERPTLGGFLAWLEAADAREDGLELPVSEPDPGAVQVSTIHASKGLEWDVVAVAGLVDGVLPATAALGKDGPKDSAWLTGLGKLPYPLRGDRADLPELAYAGAADPKDLEERRRRFLSDAGEHQVAEERRLAYVAVTRARRELLLAASWWGDGKTVRQVSPFLAEVAEGGLVATDEWAAPPEPGAANPREGLTVRAPWPADPFGPEGGELRRRRERAAGWVRQAADELDGTLLPPPAAGGPSHWERLADRLLDERRRERVPVREVPLPAHLSASALVRLRADREEFALGLRRPVPVEPSGHARLGTRFHAWVEGWFGAAALVDVDALPGADDEGIETDEDEAALREAFLATPWADRRPVAVEVDVETSVDGYVLRSRIDAVFPDPDALDPSADAVVVVDWKTGAEPTDPEAVAAREVQLAVYRLAWSRWAGVPVERVRAAFCYVRSGRTVYPASLPGEEEIVALLRSAEGR